MLYMLSNVFLNLYRRLYMLSNVFLNLYRESVIQVWLIDWLNKQTFKLHFIYLKYLFQYPRQIMEFVLVYFDFNIYILISDHFILPVNFYENVYELYIFIKNVALSLHGFVF